MPKPKSKKTNKKKVYTIKAKVSYPIDFIQTVRKTIGQGKWFVIFSTDNKPSTINSFLKLNNIEYELTDVIHFDPDQEGGMWFAFVRKTPFLINHLLEGGETQESIDTLVVMIMMTAELDIMHQTFSSNLQIICLPDDQRMHNMQYLAEELQAQSNTFSLERFCEKFNLNV
jgi:hypothetical protein